MVKQSFASAPQSDWGKFRPKPIVSGSRKWFWTSMTTSPASGASVSPAASGSEPASVGQVELAARAGAGPVGLALLLGAGHEGG